MSLVAAAPAAAAAAPAPAPAAAPAAAPGQVTLTALRADGTEAGMFPLPGPVMTVGRDVGGIFAGDSYLSPRHATFSVRGSKLFVKDELSLNGVYLKLAPESPIELQSGDVFRIGQEIIRFEHGNYLPSIGETSASTHKPYDRLFFFFFFFTAPC